MTTEPANLNNMELIKHFVAILLFNLTGSLAFSQNYALVDTGRLSLFSNGWETRGIEIETVSANGTGGMDFVNYPSVETMLI